MRLLVRKIWKFFCGIAILFLMNSVNATAVDLRAYTEEWPPYNFLNGKDVTGISTDILRTACVNANLHCDFQLVPWTRAYKTVQETKNTLIYTIARIPAREGQFVWIGPILPRTTWVYIRAELANEIHTLKDLEKFKVGAIRAEASLTELLEAGVSKSVIRIFNSNSDEMRMLKSGQIDAVVNTEIGMAMNQQQYDIPAGKLIKLIKLYEGGSLYFGMNIDSDPTLIEKLQSSVDKLRREAEINVIVQRYTNPQ